MAATTRALNRTAEDLTRHHGLQDAASGRLGDSVRVVAPRFDALLTPAQRSGTACVTCGGPGPLSDAGHVNDDGLVYAVGVCSACPPHAASLEAHR
ncbi:hypothetical protein [Streptomyces sp. LS1784]|uniref:hypothetical protein n=1 Tax=Streptomyces sp. LS1784 TaxID=2851533 RepID=UPI001CCCCB3E|nr:hypothetical protein [Streptomyces sp. LS1784]